MAISNLVLLPVNHSHQYSFKRGDFLPLQPDCLWRIASGCVRTLTWDEAGEVATLGVWGATDIVGQPLSQIENYYVQCLTNVKVDNIPFHSQDLQTAMVSHIQQLEELLNIIHCKPAALRLLKLLNWLACRFGQEVDQGWLIDLCLTHQTLAEIIGATRVTVTRLLNQYEQEGKLMRLRQHRILLHHV